MADLWGNFWMLDTETDQQVALLRDRYMTMMMMLEQSTSSTYRDIKAAGFRPNVDKLLPLNVTWRPAT